MIFITVAYARGPKQVLPHGCGQQLPSSEIIVRSCEGRGHLQLVQAAVDVPNDDNPAGRRILGVCGNWDGISCQSTKANRLKLIPVESYD